MMPMVDPDDSTGTLAGPLFAPGLSTLDLALDVQMAVYRPPLPPCKGCGAVVRFEDVYTRLSKVGYGHSITDLCERCLELHYPRLRAVMHEIGGARHGIGMQVLNEAFELTVLHGERSEA